MRSAQRFPIHVWTGWIDFSPALRHHASERIRSLLEQTARRIRSVTVRISDADPHKPTHHRCDIDVVTTDAGVVSATSVGVDLFSLVDRTAETVLETLRAHASTSPYTELHRKIA